MKRNELSKKVFLSMQVFASAMDWYDRNCVAGCTRGNFSNQSLQLWDACVELREWEAELAALSEIPRGETAKKS